MSGRGDRPAARSTGDWIRGRRSSRVTRGRAGPAALATALILAGCGDDSQAAVPSTVEVIGVDYGYEDLPGEIGAGSKIVFRNESPIEVHELVALRLEDDDDRTASEVLALPPEQLGPMLADVSSVIVAPPAADDTAAEGVVVEGSAVLDLPGRYVVFCAIPTGADPETYLEAAAASEGGPPDVPGGPPHFVEGMWAELVVRP